MLSVYALLPFLVALFYRLRAAVLAWWNGATRSVKGRSGGRAHRSLDGKVPKVHG